MKPRNRLLTTLCLMAALVVPTSCNNEFEGSLPRRDKINYPVGATFHPNGEYLYVVNSNFEARYRPSAGGTVSVIDADTLEIVTEGTPFLPSFGGHLALNDDASKAYVTARRGNVVVAYDVAADGSALACTARNEQGEQVGQTTDPAACSIGRVPDTSGGAQLPPDPFGIAVYSVQRDDQMVDVVNLSHLRGSGNTASRVSTISLPGRDISSASLQTAPLLSGNAIAQRPGTQNLYVAGRNTNAVAIFQPYINQTGEVEAIVRRGSFVLNNEREVVDARGIAFAEDGQRLFVVSQRPDALHVVNIVPTDPDEGTGTEHQVVVSIPLPNNPSDIELHTTLQGRNLAYVASAADESIQVVDVDSLTIIDEILLDASPYDIAIEPPTSGCASAEDRCRMFVTLFDDTPRRAANCTETSGCGSVAVIDINPLHRDADAPELSRYHTVTRKIQ
jgi:DNA-binding beta-propeller fold protein YncE